MLLVGVMAKFCGQCCQPTPCSAGHSCGCRANVGIVSDGACLPEGLDPEGRRTHDLVHGTFCGNGRYGASARMRHGKMSGMVYGAQSACIPFPN